MVVVHGEMAVHYTLFIDLLHSNKELERICEDLKFGAINISSYVAETVAWL